VDISTGKRPLPVRIETGLFRISQEALNNISEHARAAHVSLQLVTTPREVTLRIQDDGQGFDPVQIPSGRFGLVGLNERAKLMGGQLHIHTTPGKGTVIEVRVPLEDHARKYSHPGR
jgi:two-component system NarL family sensor kinase